MDGTPIKAALAGVRVVDFTWAASGPLCTLYLALLGAEVIKIESRRSLDLARRGYYTLVDDIDASPNFNDMNLNKLTVPLDMGTDKGRELARGLVAISDVAIQNFRPGVIDRWGLGYEELRKIRPDIVMLSSSTSGQTGPERDRPGYATPFGAYGGLGDVPGPGVGPGTGRWGPGASRGGAASGRGRLIGPNRLGFIFRFGGRDGLARIRGFDCALDEERWLRLFHRCGFGHDSASGKLCRGDACENGGGDVSATPRVAFGFVDCDDDHQFRIVRGDDAHEPSDVAAAGIATALDVQFLCGASLARDRDVLECGETSRTFGTHDLSHHVEGLARRRARNGSTLRVDGGFVPGATGPSPREDHAGPHPLALVGQCAQGRRQLDGRDRNALAEGDRGLIERLPFRPVAQQPRRFHRIARSGAGSEAEAEKTFVFGLPAEQSRDQNPARLAVNAQGPGGTHPA